MRRFTFTMLALFTLTGVLADAGAQAQTDYPAKPIRIVIGTPAGGGSELMARYIGQQLTSAWKATVVVDPRPGASGNVAAEHVAKSPPDGYTLYVPFGTHTVNPSLYAKVPYEPIRDFAPIMLVAKQFNALVVHPSVPARSTKEFVALARAQPRRMSYSSSGNGSPNHLGMELFKQTAGIDVVHIPYKGAAPSRIDMLGGHVDTMFDTLRTSLPYHEAGKMRVLAVASPRRSLLAPDMPTVAEAGWNGIEVMSWHALLAPAGTPSSIIERLHADIMLAPAFKDKLARDGIEMVAGTPAELAMFLREDMARWKAVIQAARIRLD
jgi:tripartite-type tricarboxylate transporter receptor subunit TctC